MTTDIADAPTTWLAYYRVSRKHPWRFVASAGSYSEVWTLLREQVPSLGGQRRVIQVGQALEEGAA
jgi:hypothetical protein